MAHKVTEKRYRYVPILPRQQQVMPNTNVVIIVPASNNMPVSN